MSRTFSNWLVKSAWAFIILSKESSVSRGKCFLIVGLLKELLLCSNCALASFIDRCLNSLRDIEADLKWTDEEILSI